MNNNTERLIGPAATALHTLRVASKRHAEDGTAIKVMLLGPIGVGKTEVAERFAAQLFGEVANIERVTGIEITLDLVRIWKRRMHDPSARRSFVIIVNECDMISDDAKGPLISMLDEMPAHCAFIATGDFKVFSDSKERSAHFVSRLAPIQVDAPSQEEICALVMERFPEVPPKVAQIIAESCAGCVRSALIDAGNFLDHESALAQMQQSGLEDGTIAPIPN